MDLGSVLKHSLMNPDTHPAHPEVAIMSDSIATTVSRDVSCKGTLFQLVNTKNGQTTLGNALLTAEETFFI